VKSGGRGRQKETIGNHTKKDEHQHGLHLRLHEFWPKKGAGAGGGREGLVTWKTVFGLQGGSRFDRHGEVLRTRRSKVSNSNNYFWGTSRVSSERKSGKVGSQEVRLV